MRPSKLKNKLFLFAGLVFLIILAFWFNRSSPTPTDYVSSVSESLKSSTENIEPMVEVRGIKVPVELATTSAQIERGLSGRASLDSERGLLFIFKTPYRYAFWMPDMHFPIDIIWIAGGKIIDIDKSVSPEFDPARPIYYRPSRAITHVLEVNAGWSEKHGLRIGDRIIFRNIE